MNQAQSPKTTSKRTLGSCVYLGLGTVQEGPSHFGDSTGDWVKEREEAVPSQSMTPRPRNSKGTNVPPMAFKPVGENEVVSRQRNEVPLVEQEVVSG